MALASLDQLLAKKKNQRALITALEKDLQANPVRFFRTVIMPLLPRESKLSFDREGVIQWRSLLGGSVEGAVEIQVADDRPEIPENADPASPGGYAAAPGGASDGTGRIGDG